MIGYLPRKDQDENRDSRLRGKDGQDAGTASDDDCVLVGGAESPQSETIGRDLGEVAGLKALGQTVLKDAERS